MIWKVEIKQQLIEASKQRKISNSLKKLVKLLLDGDTRFNLVYSSSRETYVTVIFRDRVCKKTLRILLLNGYKNLFLNNK
jgi:hypothetical protein